MLKEYKTETIADFLLRRLKEAGCDHIFGVPGDFVLGFFNHILKSDIEYIGTCNELNAAYAADAYSRIKGIGCVSTTYSVGELSAINGIAGSFAEWVPVVKITGVPTTKFFLERPLLHHTLGDYEAPYKMYQHVTAAQTLLCKPEMAASEIDRVLTACLQRKQPVYIGLPSDMVHVKITVPCASFIKPSEPISDMDALNEAIIETINIFNDSKQPLFIPGILILRNRLQNDFKKLLDVSGVPFSTMMLSKAIYDEDHPQYIGLYSGDRSRQYVKDRVEHSDCLVIFGERMTDFNTGGFTATWNRHKTIEVSESSVQVGFHTYHNVYIHDFIREFAKKITFRDPKTLHIKPAIDGCVHRKQIVLNPNASNKITMSRFFDYVSHYLQPHSVVLAETGASLFSAAEVLMPQNTLFIGQTFYGSIGYTIGATLGACIADPTRKVYLFIGDGSFQVTCQDLSTMLRNGCTPTIFLINNDGYTIERVIVDRPYNDIQPWKYHSLLSVFGEGGNVYDVHTEGDLQNALDKSKESHSLQFIEVHLERWDCNNALRRAGAAMALNNQLLDEDELSDARKTTVKGNDHA